MGVLTRQNGGHDVLCKDCRKERIKQRDNKRRVYIPDIDSYVVEYDPIPYEEGGFRAGKAYINHEQLRYMLQASYKCLCVGTILRDKCGHKYRVTAGIRDSLKLEQVV